MLLRCIYCMRFHRGSVGRLPSPVWKTNIFLLSGPNIDVLPSPSDVQRLKNHGLGNPVHEGTETRSSKINLNWSLSELNNFVCQSYPHISLNLVGFELARAGKGRKVKKLQVNSVRELKEKVGKSRLYILPRADVSQETYSTSAMSRSLLPEPSTAPEVQDVSPEAESTNRQHLGEEQALLDWRSLRSQQDEEYEESLLADQEKERRRQCYKALEERRIKAIEERQQRLALYEEPSSGLVLKFKYPNGFIRKRNFNVSDPIQVLFDFVGQDEMASEIFSVQQATSSTPTESTSSGSLMDHGITTSATLYVLWISTLDIQEKCPVQADGVLEQSLSSVQSLQTSLSDQALTSLSGQSPLALTSPQVLSTMPNSQVTSTSFSSQATVSQPSTQVQPILPSSEVSLVAASRLPLSSNPNLTPQVMTIEDQASASPFTEQPIILLEDQEEPPESPQHPPELPLDEDRILECSLHAFRRRRFDPAAKLDVIFVDEEDNAEGAVDEGGPTREYLRLLMRAIHQSNVFEGHENDRHLALDTSALESKMYYCIGKMISVCLVHGGIGPHFFSQRLYDQICGTLSQHTLVEEVVNHSFRQQLIKIQDTNTIVEANEAIMQAADTLSIVGALRRVTTLEERDSLVQSAADFFVNGRVCTALQQFVEGLKTLNVLDEIQKNPAVFHELFVCEEKPLLARDLYTLFQVCFSVQGSNKRRIENQTICYWRDWLVDIEEGECSPITLEMILEFASGASTVPPLGFPHRPKIEFLHEVNRVFPEANTCLIVLRLPLHPDYESFTKYMTDGVLQAPTFGVA
ncbi:G2/M phase-specific E3 ubiquitin-protein ligase-like [Gambusia affinis]|uniref:G2/M phase-specific E3 ubiquitin-protein ligase-like n=1 Tax=Gambusia affinis TaxID=33528 RepID=UPI001CDC2BED|nr:G2/M phase-specific E3 ubiquitin-protein ligase-like [Gambusia affinis]